MPTSSELLKRLQFYSNHLFSSLIILLVFSFPYSIRISAMITVLLVISWLFTAFYKGSGKLVEGVKDKYAIVFLLLFVMSILSLLNSEDKGLFHIEKKLSLLIFPLILVNYKISENMLRTTFWYFISSCAIASVYSLVNAIFKPELFGVEMTNEAIGISHVYFGLYLSFAIVLLIYLLVTDLNHKVISFVIVLLIVFFLIVMFILSGKMSIISLFLLAFVAGVVVTVLTRRWLRGFVLLCCPLVILIAVFASSSTVRSRFSYLFNKEHHFVGDNAWSSIGVRFTAYKCAREVFAATPILGTGLGDVQHDLNRCYENYNFLTVIDTNAHNQYIQILLGSGVIGLFCFLFVLVYPVVHAIRQKNYLYVCFIFLFTLCCLTESLLERQQGVMFYGFFNMILFYNSRKST